MTSIYRTEEGRRDVEAGYREILGRWPIQCEQLLVPTRVGDTFVVACGRKRAPPVVFFQGSGANAAMWAPDVATWATDFRVYAVDMIGEPGLSAPSRPPLASENYALWLDDVLRALSIDRLSIVGVSLGGWLALDYATRRPERVERLAVLSPSGLGGQKFAFIWKAVLLLVLGKWGRQRALRMLAGAIQPESLRDDFGLARFASLIFKHFRPRRDRVPRFSKATLARLTMPVLMIVGGRDVLLDSAESKRRLEQWVPRATIRFLHDAGHLLPNQATVIRDFLCPATVDSGELLVVEDVDLRAVEGRRDSRLLKNPEDVVRLIEACWSCKTNAALLYAENLPDLFFDLSSGQAGEMLQKLRNYGLRLAVVAPRGSRHMSTHFGEMVAEERQRHHFGVFDNQETARAWLRRR